MGDGLTNTQYDLHNGLLSVSVPREGGSVGSPMEGIFVEMYKGGSGILTHGKRQSCAYCQYSNLHAHLYRLVSLLV